MNKNITALIVLIIAGIATYYLVFNNNSQTTPPDTYNYNNSQKDISQTQNENNAIISIKNFSFNPTPITIKTGEKVTWINNDTAPHTITSESDGLLNSPTLTTGQSFSFVFTNKGDTDYYCTIHPSMKGKIIVQ